MYMVKRNDCYLPPPSFQWRFTRMCALIHHQVQWNEWWCGRSVLASRLLDRKKRGGGGGGKILERVACRWLEMKHAARGKGWKRRCGLITGTLSYIKYQNRCVCTLLGWHNSLSIGTARSTSFILEFLLTVHEVSPTARIACYYWFRWLNKGPVAFLVVLA
jgi:hypothetical protein